MFFILSKILQYLLMPSVWMVVLVLLILFIKKSKIRRKLFIALAVIVLFFTNPFFANISMKAWEVKTVDKTELKPKYDYGILLTGMITYDAKFERINFLRSNDRLLQTLDLYYDGIIDKIFIVGGSGELLNQKHKEAKILQDYLLHIGVPPEDIIIETESKNTYENAVNAALILKPNGNNDSYLLITSAFHMRRSIGCFKKAGFQDFDYYVANRFAGPVRFSLDHSLIPHASALEKWNLLIHEITGYVIYKIMGYA